MKKYRIAYLVIALLIIAACHRKNKSKCSDANTVKLPQHAVDYFYFKEGSWWVYEDVVTKERDSTWVCSSKKDTLSPYFLEPTIDYQYSQCYQNEVVRVINTKYNDCNSNYFYKYTIQKRGNDAGDRVYEFLEFSGMNSNRGLFRFVWKQDGTLSNQTDFEARIVDTTNFGIGTFNFKEGISYTYPKGAPSWEWQSESIYAKGVGLVSYTLNKKNKWNLIKYNIVK